MINIITRAGRTAEKWGEVKKRLRLKKAFPVRQKSNQSERSFKRRFPIAGKTPR